MNAIPKLGEAPEGLSIEVTYPAWESISVGGQLSYRYADITDWLDASGVFSQFAISYKF